MLASAPVSKGLRTAPRNRSAGWEVVVESALTHGRVPRKAIRQVLAPLGPGEACRGEVRVVVVGDSHMRRLNRDFRGKNRPTDVLAFPWGSSVPFPAEERLIGEVYCNYDHARRWSRRHGGTITEELARLAIHGCLHLLGFDHHRPPERRRMTLAENRYLRAAGLLASESGDSE